MGSKGFAHIIKNQKGILSADFIFSLIVGISVCMILFIMASTYTVVELGQYVAFSSARAMIAGNLNRGSGQCGSTDLQDQSSLACQKFNALVGNNVLKPLFNNPWFSLVKDSTGFLKLGATSTDLFETYGNTPDDYSRVVQTGVRLQFQPKVFQNLKISFLSNPPDNIDGNKGKANITGLLLREPTSKECYDFTVLRYKSIFEADRRFSAEVKHNGEAKQHYSQLVDGSSLVNDLTIFSSEDNGC